jgi:hypothetical protein
MTWRACADRYLSKIISPVPVKAFGRTSLGPYLTALGLRLHVVIDHEAFDKIKHRLALRRDFHAGMPAPKKRAPKGGRIGRDWSGNSQWGKVMHARWMLKTKPAQRSQYAREAARARWQSR